MSMPEVEDQNTVGRWARATFGGGVDRSHVYLLRLLDEVVEACIAGGATIEEIEDVAVQSALRAAHDGGFERHDLLPGELADVNVMLLVAADRWHVDLGRETAEKMRWNRSRRWIGNGDGTGWDAIDGRRILPGW